MENHSKKWFGVQLQDAIQKAGRKKINISVPACALLIAIGKFADKNGSAFPTQQELEDACLIPKDHQFKYLQILVDRGFVTVARKYKTYRGKKMTKNIYKINLNVVLNLSVDAEGQIKVEQEPVKIECSNDEPTSQMEGSSKNEPTSYLEVDPLRPNLLTGGHKATHKSLLPNRALKDIAQAHQNLDNVRNFPYGTPFEDFWASYPRKQDKQRAKKIWDRKGLDDQVELIKADLVIRMTKDVQWTSGKEFIPHASTYLTGERWNDEVIEESKKDEASTRVSQPSRREAAVLRGFEDYRKSTRERMQADQVSTMGGRRFHSDDE